MATLRKPVTDSDHIQGPMDAPVTLIEYGDFECPYCGAAYPVVRHIQQALGDQLRFVFRNFPITESHPHAEQAAEAAEAAGAQGKYWEMFDMLFENQHALDLNSLVDDAQELGLDMDRFRQDLDEHTYLERVESDVLTGARSGVNGTPTFFINKERYDGPAEFDEILSALKEKV